MTMTRDRMLTGTDEPVPAVRVLTAGPLSAELADGNLRYIRWHGHEAIRAISYLVRDANWGTCAPVFGPLTLEEEGSGFRLAYSASCRAADGAELRYDATISGSSEGRLVFDVTATPGADFQTNRCGFCILHPVVGVAGAIAEIEHTDGRIVRSHFPEAIDPAQPFMDMRAITHEIAPGVAATCRMEGDTFEMEDQRNWTDASYKTYVRPLALPWPYTLPAGQPVHQTITLELHGTPAAAKSADATAAAVLSLGAPLGRVAEFGLAVAPEDAAETLARLDRLKAVGARHLTLSFDPRHGHGEELLSTYAAIVDRSGIPGTLEFVLPCNDAPAEEARAMARMVDAAGLRLAAISASPAPDLKSTPPGSRWPSCPPFEEVYAAVRAAFPGLPLGGGMFSYFTELNRKRPPGGLIDFVTHTTSPIVHAADDRSVMESLEALPFVTGSVRAIYGEKAYRIGPSTIGMRANPYGKALADNPDGTRRMTMTADDPRQAGLFAAAWMIGYAASVASAGLDLLTLGTLAGRFGLVDGDRRRPAFHAARALAALSGSAARAVASSEPERVLGLAGGDTLLVANLTGGEVNVEVPELVSLQRLDETSFEAPAGSDALPTEEVTGGRFTLGGYGIAIGRLAAA
jgi:hypothetical protein